ncbi:hypothetical protein [Staphylothermus hellenicus]|uniref:Uncharacterized protein n=1 Tax=Staphylothermus hellenicus (strain DSM 12710 / JCM 10830 / BK20S6-10-b1 / P8) TaxID=591019 RepID=D7D9F2_STAHD|nr:hypothetical protein [Staphylothermus hellenicus]ADI32398.1 hypothetical protein Shell_1305 [Staphylothermus hellenicus DSM 12710]
MSDYIKQLKTMLLAKLAGYKILEKSPSVFAIVKDNKIHALVKDQGEYVIVTIAGKDYKYDKWYTKPEHLTNVLVNYLSQKQ